MPRKPADEQDGPYLHPFRPAQNVAEDKRIAHALEYVAAQLGIIRATLTTAATPDVDSPEKKVGFVIGGGVIGGRKGS